MASRARKFLALSIGFGQARREMRCPYFYVHRGPSWLALEQRAKSLNVEALDYGDKNHTAHERH